MEKICKILFDACRVQSKDLKVQTNGENKLLIGLEAALCNFNILLMVKGRQHKLEVINLNIVICQDKPYCKPNQTSHLYGIVDKWVLGIRGGVVNSISCLTAGFPSGQPEVGPAVCAESQMILLASHETVFTLCSQLPQRVCVKPPDPPHNLIPAVQTPVKGSSLGFGAPSSSSSSSTPTPSSQRLSTWVGPPVPACGGTRCRRCSLGNQGGCAVSWAALASGRHS